MIDFFPEYAGEIEDPRKEQITIDDTLKMRSGYPWEEFYPPYLDRLFSSWNWIPHIVDFTLTSEPGTGFSYSNTTAHLLGAAVALTCDVDLQSYGQEYLFSSTNTHTGAWPTDAHNYRWGQRRSDCHQS